RAQIRRLDELFRGAVPGMVAWNLGASPVLRFGSIRGATSLALNAPKVYVDGIEIANPVYLGSLDPATIERIEVIRGPQGAALFGSDAIGGVIQIVTRKGTPGAAPELTLDSRSAGGWVESVAGTRGGWLLDQALSASLAAPRLGMAAGGSLLRMGQRAEGGGERRAAFAGMRLAGGPVAAELSVRGSIYAWESPVNAVLRANGLRPLSPALEQPQEVREQIFGLTLQHSVGNRWFHSLTLGRDQSQLRVAAERQPQLSPADSLLATSSGEISRTSARYAGRLRLADGPALAAAITLGGDVGELRHTTGEARERRATLRQDGGVFSQLEMGLEDALFLTAGVRAEHAGTFGEAFGEVAWLPQVGAAWVAELGPLSARARAAYGRAIRPPPADAAVALKRPGFEQQPNPELAPESQSGAEAGVDLSLGARASLQLTRYDQRVEGLIQGVLLPRSHTTAFMQQNIGVIANRGWEVQGSLAVPPFFLTSTYASIDSRVVRIAPGYRGELREGDRIPEVPADAGSATLTFAAGGSTGSVTAWRIGNWINYDWLALYRAHLRHEKLLKPPRSYRIVYPPLIRYDLALTQELGRSVALLAKIENLADSRRGGRDNLQPGSGRIVSLGLRLVR
ncbi:MAG: TonB-dependent receptor, partial [Gemmatimonadetes bacterium]|nr:TonB-dependent receptor [Gemmatimonadota bacterium]